MFKKMYMWGLANLATLLVLFAGGFHTNCFCLGYEPKRPTCLER